MGSAQQPMDVKTSPLPIPFACLRLPPLGAGGKGMGSDRICGVERHCLFEKTLLFYTIRVNKKQCSNIKKCIHMNTNIYQIICYID